MTMDDAQIIDLYFDRSEAAIDETDKKYAKTYVCAIELSDIEEYFEAQKEQHP